MATRAQIIELRLLVDDPPGFVAITDVAAVGNLPANPTQQTCYYQTDITKYLATEKETGALPSDYETQRIRISDAVIADLIDGLGADAARCRALRMITTKLAAEMQLQQVDQGGDRATYTSLRDMHAFYQSEAERCEEDVSEDASNSSGRVGHTSAPEIAGGIV